MHKSPSDNSKSYGKWMMRLTWVLGLGMATFLFQGVLDKKYHPNQFLSRDSQQPVILQRNKQGHYIAPGSINDIAVVFLLDTGATDVVIGEKLALQLALVKNRTAQVATANGVVTVYPSLLKKVTLGGLTAHHVAAVINPHMDDSTVLLGMSFLKHLTLLQKGNTLTLTAP